jgi:hypothetical protein
MSKETTDRDYEYARESMKWYGWGSPIGLGIGLGLLLSSLGLFLWLLSLAGIINN